MKLCPKCKQNSRHKKLAYCHPCQKEYSRQYNKSEKGKEKIKLSVRKIQRERIGFTEDIFNQMFKSQNMSCAICGSLTPSKNNKRDWHCDHDHTTKKPRGILCAGCNTLLGRLESVGFDWVDKAKKYLSE